MKLIDWAAKTGEFLMYHDNGGVSIAYPPHCDKEELCHLDDYVVSSVSAGTAWLCPRGTEAMTRKQQEQAWRAGRSVDWRYGQWTCKLGIGGAKCEPALHVWWDQYSIVFDVPRSITVREAKLQAADWIVAEIERWATSIEDAT